MMVKEARSPLRWIFLPPFVAIGTIAVVVFLSSSRPVSVDPAWWALTGLLFIVLTILYGMFLNQGFTVGLFPLQMVAQGILLCPLSLAFGAGMLQWLGVTMAVCGASVLVAVYYRHRRELRLEAIEELSASNECTLPLLFAVTDGEGNILSISDALLDTAKTTREAALQGKITFFLKPGDETTVLGDKKWSVRQTPMEGGGFYFQLDEYQDEGPAPAFAEPPEPFVDPATQLHTQAYAFRRVGEELYRVRRYQRFLSAALLSFEFPDSAPPEDEETFWISYCRLVRANLRASDVSSLVGPHDIFLVFPETPREAAEVAVGKLLELMPPLLESYSSLEAPKVTDGILFVGASSDLTDAAALLKALDERVGKR
ncbi:MAG: hypothetical protein GX256_09110 [Fretibacterium sp.]|nr:hypothetical protein [Fretibacterium sp.]